MGKQKIKLCFYGGAREVTGACYLLEAGEAKIIVDCGMFQGCDDCDIRTHSPFPFDPRSISALVVTHAHIDHIGRIPKLVRDGFRGPIFATPPTRDLCEILLEDAMNFFKDAESALYSPDDLTETMRLFEPLEYGVPREIGKLSVTFRRSGHILGSALAVFKIGERIITFSGDLGNDPSILLPPRESVPDTETLVIESTYGNKHHKNVADRILLLERAIEDIASRRGVLMIPVFATERTQEILFEINEMMQYHRVPPIPVFVDSPLAAKATSIFGRYVSYYRDEVQELAKAHRHLFDFRNLKFTNTVAESKAINDVPPPKVVLAGSGMSSGGRIIHHEARYLSDPNSILLITGYQAAGSLGRRLVDGAREVKILGEVVPVHAEVRTIDGFSAHADEEELLSFINEMRDHLERVFVVQGESAAALGLQQAIRDRLGVSAIAPMYGEMFAF